MIFLRSFAVPFIVICTGLGACANADSWADDSATVQDVASTVDVRDSAPDTRPDVRTIDVVMVDDDVAPVVDVVEEDATSTETAVDVANTDHIVVSVDSCTPTIALGSHENSTILCSDRIDNDCDGRTDCADPFCASVAPCTDGGVDADGAHCVPTLPSGSHENTDALCSDGIDNDCNGYTDCDDFGCSRRTTGTVCVDAGTIEAGASDVTVSSDASVDASGVDVSIGSDAVMSDANCTPVLVVNELQTASPASSADEFVEIYNASSCDVSLTGWTIRYQSATGTTAAVRWTGTATDSIAAGGYAVVGGVAYTGPSIGNFGGGSSGQLAGAAAGVGLFSPDGTRVDSMGYGNTTNALVEMHSAMSPPSGQSIGRIHDGLDTNDNSMDFEIKTTPSPNGSNG